MPSANLRITPEVGSPSAARPHPNFLGLVAVVISRLLETNPTTLGVVCLGAGTVP